MYGLATLLLFGLQSLILNHIRLFGVTPFLYPMLPAAVAMYEGMRRGSIFGLVLGLVCDLLIPGPFEGFYTIAFVVTALLTAVAARNLLSAGYMSGIVIGLGALFLTVGLRILAHIMTGGSHIELMAHIGAIESVLSLPAVLVVLPVYRAIHRRCAVDY